MASFFWLIFPVGISCYTLSYGIWVFRSGNKRGGIGVCILALLVTSLAIYMLFFHKKYI